MSNRNGNVRSRRSNNDGKRKPVIIDPLAQFTELERSTFARVFAPLFRGRRMPTLQMVEEYLSGRLIDLLRGVTRVMNKLVLYIKRRRNVKKRVRLSLADCARLAAEA